VQQAGCLCLCKLTLWDHRITKLSKHVLLIQLHMILSEKIDIHSKFLHGVVHL
jgi:hypothetical protein